MPSKPAHPAFVHFPIAFLMLGFALDVVNHLSPNLPKSVVSNLPPSTDLSRAAYYALSLGLVFGVPAVLSGGREALLAIGKQGLFDQNGGLKKKFAAMFAHAIANDVILAVTGYIWYTRRNTANNTLSGKLGVGSAANPAAAYTAEPWMVTSEAVLFFGLAMASNMGGVLSYNFGMGVNVASPSTKKTQ